MGCNNTSNHLHGAFTQHRGTFWYYFHCYKAFIIVTSSNITHVTNQNASNWKSADLRLLDYFSPYISDGESIHSASCSLFLFREISRVEGSGSKRASTPATNDEEYACLKRRVSVQISRLLHRCMYMLQTQCPGWSQRSRLTCAIWHYGQLRCHAETASKEVRAETSWWWARVTSALKYESCYTDTCNFSQTYRNEYRTGVTRET